MEAFSQLISSISRKISLQKKKTIPFFIYCSWGVFQFLSVKFWESIRIQAVHRRSQTHLSHWGKKKKMFKINFNRICAYMAIKRVSLLSGNSTSHRGSSWATNDGRGNRESLRKEENKELLRHRTPARKEKLAGWFLEGSKKKKKKGETYSRGMNIVTLSPRQLTVDLHVLDENSPSVLSFYVSLCIEIHVKWCCFWNMRLLKVKIAVIRAVLQEEMYQ